MSPVEVHGRDVAREAYRVSADGRNALVPEALMTSTLRPGERPSHEDAYRWIARHATQIERALDARARGKAPRRPYDQITLAEEA